MPKNARILLYIGMGLSATSLIGLLAYAYDSPLASMEAAPIAAGSLGSILLGAAALLPPHRAQLATILTVLGCIVAVLSGVLVIQLVSR